jgi:hypothetical protein
MYSYKAFSRGYDPENFLDPHKAYLEYIHRRWLQTFSVAGTWQNEDRALEEKPHWPKQGNWAVKDLLSRRTGWNLRVRPLAQAEVEKIANDPKSREDFHDYNLIMNEYNVGTCLCELRIVSGQDCAEYLMKDAEGNTPTAGKDHWCWYLDISPRGMVCPRAKENMAAHLGSRLHQACDILLKVPTNEWALVQDPEDPQGVVAGRVTTDKFWPGPCAKCRGMKVDHDNRLIVDQSFICTDDNPFGGPNDPNDWKPEELIQPVLYCPGEEGSCHPTLSAMSLYHLDTLVAYDIPLEHIIHPEKITWAQHLFQIHQAAITEEAHETAMALADSRKANERVEKEMERVLAEEYAMSQDTAQWYHLNSSSWPRLYY